MNETLKTIQALRSVHGDFSDQEITETDLESILEHAIRAANASARQSYSIIVLDDRERMRSLFGYAGSRALVFCVDFYRLQAVAEHLGHRCDKGDIISFITGTVDTSLAAQTAVIAARALGIDSLITNGLHRNELAKVYRELGLPETTCFPLITVVLGYPREEPKHTQGRLSCTHVTHRHSYRRPDQAELDAIVSEYDDPERHLGLKDSWDRTRFAHYLDWYYTKWEGIPDGRRVVTGKIKEFQECLERTGFWWV